MSSAVAGRKRQTARHLAECSRKWRLRQETSDGRRLWTDGTAGCAAAAWTTTADGDDLAGLIPERVDADTVAPYRSTLGMPWLVSANLSWPVLADAASAVSRREGVRHVVVATKSEYQASCRAVRKSRIHEYYWMARFCPHAVVLRHRPWLSAVYLEVQRQRLRNRCYVKFRTLNFFLHMTITITKFRSQ